MEPARHLERRGPRQCLPGVGGEDVGQAGGGEHSTSPRIQGVGIGIFEPGHDVGGQLTEALLQLLAKQRSDRMRRFVW
jgi:hypothetical protein